MPDYSIENHGSIYLVRCNNRDALAFLQESVASDAQWLGNALAVEPRYLSALVNNLMDEGYTVA